MIRFRTLGTVDLQGTLGTEVRSVLAQPRRLALFAYLALARPRGFQRRDTLLAMFWPESDEERARNSLRQAVHFLRQALGPELLENRGAEEMGIARAHFWCDAIAFEEALERGEPLAALETYGGDLLRGFFAGDAPEFERWLDAERARLRTRAVQTAWRLAEQAAAEGQAAPATHWARWAVAQEPDSELEQRRLIALLIRIGDRRTAQKAYADFSDRLRREYDAEPEPETRALLEENRPRSSPPPPPAPQAATAAPGLPAPKPAAIPPRRRWGVAALVGVVGLLLAGALLRGVMRPRRSRALPPAVAIFPIVLRGHPELAYLREGLIDLLAARIDGVGGLRVIDPNAVLGLTEGTTNLAPAEAADLARRLGATYFVLGDAVEIAGRLQLSAALYAVARPSAALAKTVSEGEASDVFRLANRAAAQLLVGTVPGVDTAMTRLAGFTTPSADAFRAYVTGEAALRGGHYQQAVNAFQQAVTEDSLFALAHYRLAVAADWVGNEDLEQRSAGTAVRLGGRLSPLARSMLAGFQAYVTTQGDTAEHLFAQIVAAHPDNVEAQYMLGESRFHYNSGRGRPLAEAREAFEQVLALDPDHPHALIHLARIAAAEGHHEELDSLVGRFLALRPDADRALEMEALRAFATTDAAERNRILSELRRASDVVLLQVLQSVAALDRDPVGAAQIASLFEAPKRGASWHAYGLASRARLETARGRWSQARPLLLELERTMPDWGVMLRVMLVTTPLLPVSQAEIEETRSRIEAWADRAPALNLPVDTSYSTRARYFLLGLLAEKSGRPETITELRHWADTLDRLAAAPQIIGYRWMANEVAHGLRARAERHGNPARALAELDQIPFGYERLTVNQPETGGPDRFVRAELLHQLGRDDEALQWYESFPSPNAYDIAFLAPARLRAAQILERQGKRSSAAEHYRQVVALWDDCDSALVPLVDSARAALRNLTETSVSH